MRFIISIIKMKTFIVLFALVVGCLGAKINPAKILVDLARNVRIVNGEAAADGEFPFHVSLQNNGRHYCGATVLSTEYVLTAAHCIIDGNIDRFTVRAGTNNYNSGGTVHQVVEWKYHEQYQNYQYWYNDIAVVKVSPPLMLSSKVQLVTLPAENSEPAGGAAGVAVGWGSECYGCGGIANLQKVNLRIYSHNECIREIGSGPTQDMVCSGSPGEGKGVCDGDSGGALLVNGVQVGVTSWTAIPCAESLAVWTKVSHYRSWIRQNTGV